MKSKDALADVGQGRPQTMASGLIAYGAVAAVTLEFVVCATRLFRLISHYAVNIFFSDQWRFDDGTLFQQHSVWQMFAWQHGPHRQGLGALFAKLIEPYFRWNSRTESFVVGGIVVAAAMCALYLKQRLYGRLSVVDVLIPAIFFTPAQYETLFVTANFAHGPLPLLLILLYCLSWTCQQNAVRYPLILLINFVTIYTGFGFFLGVITPILLLVDYCATTPSTRLPKSYLLGTVLLSLASLGSFFIGYKFNAAVDCFSFQLHSPASYAAYMAIMFANFFAVESSGALAQIFGVVVMLALLASLASAAWQLCRGPSQNLPNGQRARPLVAAALISYCFLFCMNTAYGRLCGGLWTAHSSRYVIYLELGVLGLYFHLLNLRRPWLRRCLVTALLAPVLVSSLHVNRQAIGYFPDIKLRWRSCYLQFEDAEKCNQIVGYAYTHRPEGLHIEEKLQYLKRSHENLYSDTH